MSPEADAVMGIVIGAVAVDAVRHVYDPSQRALASLPVILAAHQLIEVFVWMGLDGRVAPAVGRAAVYAYLLIAFGVPLLIPRAVAAMELDDRRRHIMERLGFVGALVSLVLLAGVATGPVTATDQGDHIAYQATVFHGEVLTAIYVIVIVACLLASSHRFVVIFGALNLVAVTALAWMTYSGFVSLWCSWAALTSLVIAVHIRSSDAMPRLLRHGDGTRAC